MNKANLVHHWGLVVAFKEGKTIQWFNAVRGEWFNTTLPEFYIDQNTVLRINIKMS